MPTTLTYLGENSTTARALNKYAINKSNKLHLERNYANLTQLTTYKLNELTITFIREGIDPSARS